MEVSGWNYQDYLTYLYLFAAHEDYEVDREEKSWIISRVGREEYTKVNQQFSKNRETDHLEIIQHFGINYCSSNNEKRKVLKDLRNMFNSNGHFSSIEQVLLLGIGRLL